MQPCFLAAIEDFDHPTVRSREPSLIAYLPTSFCIEGCAIEDHLNVGTLAYGHFAKPQKPRGTAEPVVSDKFRFRFFLEFHPVFQLHLTRRGAPAAFPSQHEILLIDPYPLFLRE